MCRDCGFSSGDEFGGRCISCGSRRITCHEELFNLSVAHIDCDAFYAAVEKRDDPSLADRPVIVGGGKRGVVTTACYVARTYGVRSAMPMFKALKACPDAVVIKPDFKKYSAAGREVRAKMESVTPLVEPVSIDEAFLDLKGTERIHNAPPAVTLARLQREIKEELGITVSVGLSFNKFLAKIASDFDKPSGFSIIGEADAEAVLSRLPVSAIWGVGVKMAEQLNADGISTIADIQRISAATLAGRYGEIGLRLAHLSRGRDRRKISTEGEAKSVSAETTFNQDICDVEELEAILWPLCEKVARRMKGQQKAGRVVTLKLKDDSFKTYTRRTTLEQPSNLAHTLFEESRKMLHESARGRHYRLIGTGYSDLLEAAEMFQPTLFGDPRERAWKEEAAIDRIRERFGDEAIALGRTHAKIVKRPTARTGQGKEKLNEQD